MREKLLFVLTLLWGVDHLVGWFVYSKYGIGITALAVLVMAASLSGVFFPQLAPVALNALIIVFFVGLLGPAQSTMTFAFLLATLLGRLTLSEARPWGGAYIASGVYLFAGLNKMFSEDWQDGKIVGFYFPDFVLDLRINEVIAGATVFAEIGLALALFLRLRLALVGILALHVGIVLLVSTDPHHYFSLALYGGVMFHLAYWGSTLSIRNFVGFFRGAPKSLVKAKFTTERGATPVSG